MHTYNMYIGKDTSLGIEMAIFLNRGKGFNIATNRHRYRPKPICKFHYQVIKLKFIDIDTYINADIDMNT